MHHVQLQPRALGHHRTGKYSWLILSSRSSWIFSILLKRLLQAQRFARVCLEEAIKYAHKRRTFGQRLIDHPVIRNKALLLLLPASLERERENRNSVLMMSRADRTHGEASRGDICMAGERDVPVQDHVPRRGREGRALCFTLLLATDVCLKSVQSISHAESRFVFV